MIAFALALSVAPPAVDYTVWGWGGESCGSWSAAAQRGPSDERRIVYKAWLTGYVTAINVTRVARNHPDYDMDAEGMVGWVDNYCKAHPLERISIAAMSLTFELSGV